MPGSGLPIPQTGVLAQSPGVVDGDRYSSAQAWSQIARSGARLAAMGEDAIATQLAGDAARLEVEGEEKRSDLREKHAYDPAGFRAAWGGFVEGKLGTMAPGNVDRMRRYYGGVGAATYGQINHEKATRDRDLADDNLTARLKLADRDAIGLASTGRGGSDDFKASVATWDEVQNARVAAKLVDPQKVALEREDLLSRASGETVLSSARQLYAEKGLVGALKDVEAALNASTMSPADRRRYLGLAEAEMRTREVERRTDVNTAMIDAKPVIDMLERGTPGLLEPAQRIVDRLRELRAPAEAAKVQQAMLRNKGFIQGRAGLPTREWDAAAAPNDREAFAMKFFIDKGWTPAQAAGIVGNLVGESGRRLDPTLTHDGGTGLGIAGWRDETPGRGRKTTLEMFATGRGKPATDFETQLEFLAYELNTTEKAAGDKLRAAKDPRSAAVAMLDFERPGGWKAGDPTASNGYENRQRDAERLLGARVVDVDPDTLQGMQEGTRARFDEQYADLKRDAATFGITREGAQALVDMAGYLDPPRQAKLREILTTGQVVDALGPVSTAEREQFLVDVDRRAAGGDAGARALGRDLEVSKKRFADLEARDPIARGQGVRWLPDDTVDWGLGQAALTAQIEKRRRGSEVVAAKIGKTVVPALRLDEAQALATALTSGPSERIRPLMVVFQGALLPEQFAATMAMGPVRDALGQMARSGDVKRMTAAFSVYDAMYRDNPAEFEAAYGSATVGQLQTWRDKLRFYTEAEIMRDMRRADDPARLQARKALEAQAKETVKAITAEDVAKKFGGSWFSSARVGPDAAQNALMTEEFRRLYVERFVDTGDAALAEEQAMDRLAGPKQPNGQRSGGVWGVSDLNGGRLMRRPPEYYYKAVRGSRDWMQEHLESVVREVGGAEAYTRPGSLLVPGSTIRAGALRPYYLMADDVTESDLSAGRPPSYVLVITDHSGRLKIPEADGKAKRFNWDFGPVHDADMEAFERQREQAGNARELRNLPPGVLESYLSGQRGE